MVKFKKNKSDYTRDEIIELINSGECVFEKTCACCPLDGMECDSLTENDIDRIMEFYNPDYKNIATLKEIKVKYFSDVEPLEKINNGDWIDLRAAEKTELRQGEFRLIPLGVGMILPDRYEANIVPRSSTFKKWGIIQTNHFAVIDNSYSGDNDQWYYPVYATRDTVIEKNDRICQFRINAVQPSIQFNVVEHLNADDRGGFGSTGSK